MPKSDLVTSSTPIRHGMPIQSVKTECQEAGFSLRTTERAAHNLDLDWTRKYAMNVWSLPKGGNESAA